MDTVSSNSIRFHRLIITFACLPLFGLLLSSVFSSIGLMQTVQSATQATPPTSMVSEHLPYPDLPQPTMNVPLVATALPQEMTALCAELDWVPGLDFCTHADKSTSTLDRYQPMLSVAGQGRATIPNVQK